MTLTLCGTKHKRGELRHAYGSKKAYVYAKRDPQYGKRDPLLISTLVCLRSAHAKITCVTGATVMWQSPTVQHAVVGPACNVVALRHPGIAPAAAKAKAAAAKALSTLPAAGAHTAQAITGTVVTRTASAFGALVTVFKSAAAAVLTCLLGEGSMSHEAEVLPSNSASARGAAGSSVGARGASRVSHRSAPKHPAQHPQMAAGYTYVGASE